ncbi:hypothetical protein Tco_0310320, partial [Tanacetum coccineum]
RLENKKAEQLTQSQSGTIDDYVIKIPHVSSSNNEDVGGGDNNDEYVDEDGVNNTDVNNEDVNDVNNEDVDDVKLYYNDDDDDDDVPIEECNTPKMGRSGIRIRGMLLQDQQHKI